MQPWLELARSHAPDGTLLQLRRRGDEYLIRAGKFDLMSSEDAVSSAALARLGCAHVRRDDAARVLVGGLGMGFTLRAALDAVGPLAIVEVAELVPAVVQWNREWLGALADRPLDDPRTRVIESDVLDVVAGARSQWDAILLDVDNGPDALAHARNAAIYDARGIASLRASLVPGGAIGVWSFSDDPAFTRRLARAGLDAQVHRVPASRRGRGRTHVVWIARAPAR